MRRLIVLSMLAVITSSAITPVQAQEIPPRVREVSASIMMLCTRLEMHGIFKSINARGESIDTPDIEEIETCSNAFQISENRVLSAAHVNNDVKVMLTQYFEHKLAVLERHGFLPGNTPEKIDKVTLLRFLISFDGHRFTGPLEEYGALWSGELKEETVQRFLVSLVPMKAETQSPASAMAVLATDTDSDLTLLSISPSHEQKAYVSLSPGENSIGTSVWGVAALLPWNRKGELNLVIGTGTLHQPTLSTTPRESVVINMRQPTMGGYSGGFVVDDGGQLIGVTQASTALEHSWSFDLPHPCSDSIPCRRVVVSTDSVREFMKIHDH